MQQGKGAVEPHIEAFVPGVIEALEHAKAAHRISGARGAPEGAATGQVIELVAQGHAQLLGQVIAQQHRCLPLLDLLAPDRPALQGLAGDGGSVGAIDTKKVGVAPEALGAGGKGGDRQVPTDHHWKVDRLTGLQCEAQGQRRARRVISATAAIVVALRNGAVGGKALPDLGTIAVGIPAAAAHQLNAFQPWGHSQAPLPLALADGIGALAFQQHAMQPRRIDGAVALTIRAADGRPVVVLRAAVVAEVHRGAGVGVAEPAGGVAPAQHQREGQRRLGRIAQAPAEHRHGQRGVAVVPGKDGTEALAADLSLEDPLVVEPAEGIAGAVAASAALRRAGGVPAPASQGSTRVWIGAVVLGGDGQGVGATAAAVVFKEGELAVGQRTKPMLTAIEMPEVEITFGTAANAAGAKAAEGSPMPGAVIKVAGVLGL